LLFLVGVTRLRALLLLAGLAGCSAPAAMPMFPAASGVDPDDGLLRDFRKDQKTDEAGHPVNAVVLEAETFCHGSGGVVDGGYRSDTTAGVVCDGTLPLQTNDDLIVNIRLRASGYDASSTDDVVAATLRTSYGAKTESLTGRSFRAEGQWMFLPLALSYENGDAQLTIETFGRGAIELDYIETFPNQFPVALGPGSGVLDDAAVVTIEGPLHDAPPVLTVNGRDAKLVELLMAGTATRDDTTYRSLYSVAVGTLAAGDANDLDILVGAMDQPQPTARMHVYRTAPPCVYQGDERGRKVLVTGFQPFPVDEAHDNVSGVAVMALDASPLRGAQVMRLVLPVEYDGSPALVASAISRCAPDVVISFGQGDDGIALERTAYNLKASGELTDNRGHFQAGVVIDPAAPPTRPSTLPLDRIKAALTALPQDGALGQIAVADSEDPGRYVCNDTFFGALDAVGTRTIAGFIHLPYTSDFTLETRAAWGQVVRTIIEAAVADAAE
jgi:pyrrolidone-carboxylate peptidase